MKINKRQISESLLKMLDKGGIYHEITEIVKVDPYLDMEMRGSTGAIVYYRGGKLLTIHEKKGLLGLDRKYYHWNETATVTPDKDNIFEYVCKAKYIIDKYESNVKSKLGEKEIQQRVVYENNLSVNADNTDYFIVDVEWADNNKLGGRADIVAFRWMPSHKKRCIQLTLIEVKQGANAIKTTISKDMKVKPGLRKHYEDYIKFLNDRDYVRDFSEDMLCVLKQKYNLGLIKGLDKLFSNGKKDFIPIIDNDTDFVFLLANYHHYSSELKKECESLPDNCKFYTASFMGYGLYWDFIFKKSELKDIFPLPFTRK